MGAMLNLTHIDCESTTLFWIEAVFNGYDD